MKIKSKKLNLRYNTIIILLIAMCFSASTYAQTILEKTLENTVDLPKTTKIELGLMVKNLEYKTWDKNKLKVVYKIYIETRNKEKSAEFFEIIENHVKQSLNKIRSGIISFNPQYKMLSMSPEINRIKFKTLGRTYKLIRFEVSMTIYAPKNYPLKLHKRTGNVYIDDLQADADINISSVNFTMGKCRDLKLYASFCKNMKIGDIKNANISLHSSDCEDIGTIAGNLELTSRFSDFENKNIGKNATVNLHSASFATNSVNTVDLNARFAKKIRINQANNINIRGLHSSSFETKKVNNLELNADFARTIKINKAENIIINRLHSSNFDVDTVKNIRVEDVTFSKIEATRINNLDIEKSSSNKFYIDKINNLEVENAAFSNFRIDELAYNFICNSRSGNIRIKDVKPTFQKIKIDGQFVDVDINFDTKCEYKFLADLMFPKTDINNLKYNSVNKSTNSIQMSGLKGNNAEATSKVTLDCRSCSISLD